MVSASSMLGNFLQHAPGIMFLIDTFFMIAGVVLVASGLRMVVTASDNSMRQGLLQQGTTSVWIVPIATIIVGVLLFNRFGTATMMLSSIFGSSVTPNTLLNYSGQGGVNSEFDALVSLISLMMRIFGYVTFFIGWMTLRKPEREGAFKLGASKVIFGVFLINNVATVNGLTSLFGFGDVL